MECETVVPREVNLALSGATIDKNNDDGTRTVWSIWFVWTAWPNWAPWTTAAK